MQFSNFYDGLVYFKNCLEIINTDEGIKERGWVRKWSLGDYTCIALVFGCVGNYIL